MILSHDDIVKAIKDGTIGFDPQVEARQIGEASVDLRLGYQFTKYREDLPDVTISVAEGLRTLGELKAWKTLELGPQDELGRPSKFVLEPKEFILGITLESITVPRSMIALVEGRSTYARVGLSMHQTAPWIQPGWSGPIILEMTNHGPLNIQLRPGVDRPCQVTFFKLTSEVAETEAYGARATDVYKDQTHPLRHDPTARR
ncbi:MAG TPA: dCTP deaminase [Alphaproteobacteria bacterium]